jgi:hypothetical protein
MSAILPPPLAVVTLTPEERETLTEYQAFLTAKGLTRKLLCRQCGEPAEPGTGQLGWACACRLLVWRPM